MSSVSRRFRRQPATQDINPASGELTDLGWVLFDFKTAGLNPSDHQIARVSGRLFQTEDGRAVFIPEGRESELWIKFDFDPLDVEAEGIRQFANIPVIVFRRASVHVSQPVLA